jgi:hypothetical protein
LNSYLSGVNSVAMPDFDTPMFRARDASLYSSVDCLGGGNFGVSFNMGSSGSTRVWASDISKLLIQTSSGTKVMVAFDPATGRVTPTNLCGGYLPGATTFSSPPSGCEEDFHLQVSGALPGAHHKKAAASCGCLSPRILWPSARNYCLGCLSL